MSITITESAAQQIQKQLQKQTHAIGLRLGVKASGCSGYAYVLDYADQLEADDDVFEQFDVKIIVKQADLDKLNGIQLDFVKEGFNQAFKFNNPNVKGMCGCGESFAV
ncbi:MAG: iron-sulfur cluster assembly accessory protein [Methylococcaceae bacterium]|jgi:iron-sulfur cluster assembly protein|nr:iron-sulfur cluster assembly accessory protein [Methylococcaceae bacterium]